MLLSPYAAQGLGSGLSKVLEQKLQQKYFKDKLMEQEESLKRQNEFQMQAMKDKYNFYKSQIEPYLGEIVNDKNASGLLANLYARTGSLPVSQFMPKEPQPIIEKVREGEALTYIDPKTGEIKQLYKYEKKQNPKYEYKVIDGTVAVFNNGQLIDKYPIVKKKEHKNYTIYEGKPYQGKDGNWYFDRMIFDKNTGQFKKITTKRTQVKQPKNNKWINTGSRKYQKDLLSLATRIVDDYFNPDPFTGKITVGDRELTPEEAAALRTKLVKETYDKLIYSQQNPNPTNPESGTETKSVKDLYLKQKR